MVHAVEERERAQSVAEEIEGELLARTLVREGFVPVLTDVYDRLALTQDAAEQALYGHLYRLAIGDERNFCRVSKRDLMARTRLSERRLLKTLAGLVAKGHVSLVHRDRRGTLYRVHLPHEVFGEGRTERVIMAGEAGRRRAAPPAERGPSAAVTAPGGRGDAAPPAASPPAAARARPAPAAGAAADTLQECTSVGALAAAFCAQHGGPGRDHESVLEEILARLEEGRTLREVADELVRFARAVPKRTPVSDLGRFIASEGDV